jgi:hypothetical protein
MDLQMAHLYNPEPSNKTTPLPHLQSTTLSQMRLPPSHETQDTNNQQVKTR